MNKIILSFMMLSVISCTGSDEDQNSDNKSSMIGTWYVEKTEIYKSLNQQVLVSFSTECQKMSTHEFTTTHLFSISFAQNNNTCEKADVVIQKYTFVEANSTFWFEGQEKYPYYITKLNESDMVVEDRTQDFDGDGAKDVLRRFYKRIK
ncbi:lipocalin family protein [Chryseobacterium mucoviscidosis]|uniref:lipocalin family protein n=1 Tax=Chryseobacterium mucoviscidosis TaxID=1945581 RepID=UPI0031DC0E10